MEQSNFLAKRAFMFTFKTAFLLCRERLQRDPIEREDGNKGESVWAPIFLQEDECLDMRALGIPSPSPTVRPGPGEAAGGRLETLLLGAQPWPSGQAQVRTPAAAPGSEGSPQGLEKNCQTLTSGSCGFVISGPCLE